MYRVLLRLRKGEEIKYLSHRDFIRAFEFASRRARVPVAFSEGFNPRIKMSFGNALGVGVTSDDELIQLDLAIPMELSDLKDRLGSKLPKGMELVSLELVPEGVKSPLSKLNASEYEIVLSKEAGCSDAEIKDMVDQLLAAPKLLVTREKDGKSKQVDIRPYLLEASIEHETEKVVSMHVSLSAGDSGGAGPRDFLKAVRGLLPDLAVLKTHRLRQFFSE